MNRTISLFLPLLLAATSGSAQRWQQQVNYSIDVTLTDSTHSLDGSIRIQYYNHSPDTLSFIWIRCWANAFKNDRTAFSEQLIRNGRTDFYFSGQSRRGYLNRLEFRVNGQLARMEDHPRYIDVIKVILPAPLVPGDSASLTTPFHVQLPDNFTGDGYHQGVYQITQWYPKPAVYDNSGWHPDPYLSQGGSYNEFGDFDVRITVPSGFMIAATGQAETSHASTSPASASPSSTPTSPAFTPPATPGSTTSSYHQTNIPDFVWFASRRFHRQHDTLQLPSGRIIDLFSYYLKTTSSLGKNGIVWLKEPIRFYSALLGDYPYQTASVVETRTANDRPSQPGDAWTNYPAIVAVDERDTIGTGSTIPPDIIGSWLSSAIGADGYRYPWMTDGLGRFCYDSFWLRNYRRPFMEYYKYIPDTLNRRVVNTRAVLREDQPVSTSSEDFTKDNYRTIALYKTAIWMLELERSLGAPLFDSCIREYFRRMQFHHAGPEDLKAAFVTTISRLDADPAFHSSAHRLNIDSAFALLDATGPVPPSPYHRPLAPNIQFVPHAAHHNYLNISPALGFNNYDEWMVGALIHNYNLPPGNWQLLAAPLYSATSHQWNGVLHFNYAWYPHKTFRLIEAGINALRFSTISGTDSNSHAIFGGFYKIVPYVRFFFPPPSVGGTRETSLEAKVYLIGEKSFDNYVLKSADSLYYPTVGKYDFRYLNQLTFTIRDRRVLYPYSVNLQIQQAADFYRVNLDIRYFFNYATAGGLDVRLFGAKFGYLGARNPALDLSPFEPKLTAVRGSEDYTYDNYFIGRNDFNGLASQQIMSRDGDLKLRTDLFQGLQGRSDNWVAAVNLKSTLPPQVVPDWLPLRLFLDVGTYAQAWSDNPPTGHFLYAGGIELDLLHNVLCIYAPLIYSSDFSNQLKTVPGQNGFFQKVSFSIDFQQIPFRKWFGYTPF
ncbi:MAG TPA: M1 family metallopeptidase [Puia sp.]|jgi:hypothetical protein|nr:M1 family metallopeptidase [Puia sp.]